MMLQAIFAVVPCDKAFVTCARAQQRPAPVLPDSSQSYCLPIDMEPFLAGNFGEIRNNHFHAGLDFKTQSTVDHPVYAFADGYVHRADINAYGYGLCLYIRHPQLGLTSVYAHLNSFSDYIFNNVRAKQVELELNNAQLTFEPNALPVRKGEVIALSGNTGSSGGPHVHFELRDCNDEDDEFFNPMPFFRDRIADRKPPRASHIYLYPLGGVACGSRSRQSAQVITVQSGKRTINRKFTAWGRVGVGLKAYDYMENQSNSYGIYRTRLFVDDKLIYDMCEDRFFYSERRAANTVTDFSAWQTQRSMINKSFVESGNKLRMIDHSLGDGTINIDEERVYRLRYVLTDAHGNESDVNFEITGKRTTLTEHDPLNGNGLAVRCLEGADFDSAGFSIHIEPEALYTDQNVRIRISSRVNQENHDVSKICVIGDPSVPIHSSIELSIPIPQAYSDTLTNPEQLYVATPDGRYIGGKVVPGKSGCSSVVKCNIREFGSYVVRRDKSKPSASFVTLGWNKAQISVADTGSGIDRFKVFIDGKFVPFDQNRYGSRLSKPRDFGIEKGRNHDIRIWLIDKCGNEQVIETRKYF